MVFLGGINEVVSLSDFADAAALEESVSFEIRRVRNAFWRFFQRQHIITEHGGVCTQWAGLLQECLGRFSKHTGINLSKYECGNPE